MKECEGGKMERGKGEMEREEGRMERGECLVEVVERELNIMSKSVEGALRTTSEWEKGEEERRVGKCKEKSQEQGEGRGRAGVKRKKGDQGLEEEGRRWKASEETGSASPVLLPAIPTSLPVSLPASPPARSRAEAGMDEHEGQCRLPAGVKRMTVGAWVSATLSSLLQEVVVTAPPSSTAQDSVVVASCLLDNTWQHLNTGHWRDVAPSWRLVFTWSSVSLAALLLRRLLASLQHHPGPPAPEHLAAAAGVVRACDRGLLMGSDMEHNPLHAAAAALNTFARLADGQGSEEEEEEALSGRPENPATVTRPLPTDHRPALDRFLLHYMERGKPVRLLGVVDHWPALHRWSLGYLRRVAGARTVPVEVGARYTDHSWYQRLMSLDDYITTYMTGRSEAGEGPGYLAQHQLLDQVPQLQEDILVPDYCHLGDTPPRLHAWLGPRGTISPLHHDPDHNILVQVVGYKYVRVYTEDQTHLLYPHPDPLLSNTSQVDVEAPGAETTWPLLREANYQDLVLGPGQALYIPPRCWHYVRSLSVSFSVSFWWT